MDVITRQLEYVNNLNNDLKKSILWYTKSNYKSLNKVLREKSKLSDTQAKNLVNIDYSFLLSPRSTENIYVYRGINSSEIYSVHGFLSTSLDKNEAINFINDRTCCLLEILVPENSKFLPVMFLSQRPTEQEIILDRDGTITVLGKRVEKIYYTDSSYHTITVLKCVYTKGEKLTSSKNVIKKLTDEANIEAIIKDIEPRLDTYIMDKLPKSNLEKYVKIIYHMNDYDIKYINKITDILTDRLISSRKLRKKY